MGPYVGSDAGTAVVGLGVSAVVAVGSTEGCGSGTAAVGVYVGARGDTKVGAVVVGSYEYEYGSPKQHASQSAAPLAGSPSS